MVKKERREADIVKARAKSTQASVVDRRENGRCVSETAADAAVWYTFRSLPAAIGLNVSKPFFKAPLPLGL